MGKPFRTESQIGSAFAAIAIAGGIGMLLLVAEAFGQSSWRAGWRHLFIGGMAAIAGLGCGGIVGLIFGLPESAPAVIAAPAAAEPTAGPPQAKDWYRDSSSLERIATWLTGAIIALSLANFDSWTTRFSQTATSVGLAMQGATVADMSSASSRAIEAEAALRAIAKAPGETEQALAKRRTAAALRSADAAAEALRDKSAAEVLGGLLLGGYAFIGFAGSYLWTRRYLPAELARARRDMRRETRLDDKDAAELAAARANNLSQEASKSATDPEVAAKAVAAASTTAPIDRAEANLPPPQTQPVVKPGPIRNDPWKAQFGGLPFSDTAEVSATVRGVAGVPDRFLVSLVVRGRDSKSRAALAGSQARLYLHPTFPEPIIRTLDFDKSGLAEVKMSAFGAFTVGIQLMSSGELLEIDLSELPNAPAAFRLN